MFQCIIAGVVVWKVRPAGAQARSLPGEQHPRARGALGGRLRHELPRDEWHLFSPSRLALQQGSHALACMPRMSSASGILERIPKPQKLSGVVSQRARLQGRFGAAHHRMVAWGSCEQLGDGGACVAWVANRGILRLWQTPGRRQRLCQSVRCVLQQGGLASDSSQGSCPACAARRHRWAIPARRTGSVLPRQSHRWAHRVQCPG
mmetsp:Transcript_136049/g.379178  ORF Transcript_136049/g.379178 Transcript_136049/m.379178 type:complete len:205 (+) Transcript_136049:96-710(+)